MKKRNQVLGDSIREADLRRGLKYERGKGMFSRRNSVCSSRMAGGAAGSIAETGLKG